jgi:D-inositol-3-phosphate glycosyltransferase
MAESESGRPRILYSFPHTIGNPGIGTTAAHQVQELIAQHFDVYVYCTCSRANLKGATRVVQTLVVAGHRIPHRVLGVERAYRYHDQRVALAIPRLAGAVDLIHAWPVGCLRTFAAAAQVGIPSFREVPNPHTESAFEDAGAAARAVGVTLPRADPHRYTARRLSQENAEFEAANFLLLPSEYVRSSFTVRGYPEDKLLRHRYGFDPVVFSEPGPSDQYAKRPFTAIFVGRGEPRKGLHFALRAWLDSGVAERGQFLVCGSIIPDYRRVLAPMLGHPSIRELGFVTDPGTILRSADVLVFPTVSEGSALVTYEAMASGCVPLVSDAAGACTRHMSDGLVHHVGDVGSLTKHLHLLAEDRALLARLRQGALSRRGELSWEAAARALGDAYRTGLARKGASL